jgi:hypothetical protein
MSRVMKRHQVLRALLAGSCLLLDGCFAPLVEGARQGMNVVERDRLQASASAGEAQAQYKLGTTYCCETGPGIQRSLSVFDNRKATEWLCKAALQDYAPAQYKLAQIYAGRAGASGGMITRIGGWIDSERPAPSVAWIWASRAAANGIGQAASLRDTLGAGLDHARWREMNEQLAHWRTAPCTWDQAVGTRTAAR